MLKEFEKHHGAIAGLPVGSKDFSNYSDVIRKNKRTHVNIGSLSRHEHLLFDNLSEPWMDSLESKKVRGLIFMLTTLVTEYCHHPAKENVAKIHQKVIPDAPVK